MGKLKGRIAVHRAEFHITGSVSPPELELLVVPIRAHEEEDKNCALSFAGSAYTHLRIDLLE
ncbi:MAG: hypothetical protein SV686_00805 [Thermodesulfobacteriota bacterium]|nr:hypothetical protein [Thermodesulfobacteriota bacterium]